MGSVITEAYTSLTARHEAYDYAHYRVEIRSKEDDCVDPFLRRQWVRAKIIDTSERFLEGLAIPFLRAAARWFKSMVPFGSVSIVAC